jgi:hypothetical protein
MTPTVGHFQHRRAPFGERRVMSARFLGRRASRTLRIMVALGVLWQALSLAAAVPPAHAALPDNRAYELVSPPTEGEPYLPATTGPQPVIGFVTQLPFRAAAGGDAVTYTGEPGVSTGTGEIGPGTGNQWSAVRTETGWHAEDVTPTNGAARASDGAIYQSFSDDLTTWYFSSNRQHTLTEDVEPGCAALYTRTSASSSFKSLFTAGLTPKTCGNPLYVGATADDSAIIFQSEAALASGAEEATEVPTPHTEGHGGSRGSGGCLFGCNLYEAIGGHLRVVNELDGEPVPGAVFGGYAPALVAPNFSNAISSDGSRIYWTDTQAFKNGEPNPNMEHVFVLENGTSTVAVSGGQPAEYWGASPDGHYAFYTADGRLWRFDSQANEREPLTAEGAEVQGVLGINQTGEDGGYVYFVANGVLTGEPNARGEHATPGGYNLYLLHAHATIFITGLSRVLSRVPPPKEVSGSLDNNLMVKDSGQGEGNFGGDWRPGLGERVAQVTPDGKHLGFESVRELTGYNSGFREEAERAVPQVFVYAADSAQLTCASCNPTGAPFSQPDGAAEEAKVPMSENAQTYVERWISQDGNRVFFNTREPLVPEDTNGVNDVYEWERPAAADEPGNTCTAQSASYSAVTGGCTFLLSGGEGSSPSVLVDADASGNNVFFEHYGRLGQVEAPVDHKQLYDARVNGGFPEPSLACSGTGCQGVPPAAPSFATPSSVTFNGTGDFPPPPPTKSAPPKKCKKGFVNKKGKCVKKPKPKSKKKAKKAKRASYDRRAH